MAADVLAVSAFAHVLIGYNDVRRIRAEEVAAEREKLAVLNRVVRHDLRTEVQTLTGYAELLAAEYAEAVGERVRSLGELHDDLERAFETLEHGETTETFALDEFLPGSVEEMRVAHPDAEIGLVDPGDGIAAEASPELRAALAELVANSVEHGSTGDRKGAPGPGAAADGPGIPETERAVVSGETAIDQLDHGQGIGLWFVKWVADLSGGSVEFDEDAAGGVVTLRLPRAAA